MPNTMKTVFAPHTGGRGVVRITGRLDFTSAPEASKQFATAIAGGHPKLVLDLAKVGFVDSAGLGSLIGGMRAARLAGGDLRIANPSEQVTMLLSLTSLDQVLTIHPTVDEALNGFS